MSGNVVKIRLRAGDREIDIEGPRADVNELLEKWWSFPEEVGEEEAKGTGGSSRRGKTRSKGRAAEGSRGSESGDAAVSTEAHEIARQMKEDASFDRFEKKVLHARKVYHKVALISWFAKRPLPTGIIHKALSSLLVKIDLPAVSRALKSNKFLTDTKRARGGRADYSLTSQARSEFEKWLLADGS